MNTPIRYWIEQTSEYPLYYSSEGIFSGLYADLISTLEDETGCDCELVSSYGGQKITAADALDLLERGELDLVLGLPSGLSGEYTCLEVYKNVITAVIRSSSPNNLAIGSEYWGIDSALLPLTRNTPLDGHVLDYNDCEGLWGALESEAVYGILIRRSHLDYFTHTEKASDFTEYEGIKIPCADSIYMNPANTVLNTHVDRIAQELADRYSSLSLYSDLSYFPSANISVGSSDAPAMLSLSADTLAIDYNRLNSAYDRLSLTSVLSVAGIALSLILAVICGILLSKNKKAKRLEQGKLRTIFDKSEDKELFEIDLVKKTIRAYDNFSIFGVNPDRIPNPVSLDELSELIGFDFSAHYSSISLHGNTIYKNRFIIFVGGRKLYISENGNRVGSTVLLTMTLIRN